MAKNATAKNATTTKKIPKKTGPNEKIPEPTYNHFGTIKAIIIGFIVGTVFIVLLMNGYLDKFLNKGNDVNIANREATATPSITSKIPINLPPKITASPKSTPPKSTPPKSTPPKSTPPKKTSDAKGPNEPGYRVSGGQTSSGEKGWIKEVVTPGDGKSYPKKGDVVVMHYVGKLANGKVFDSSRQRGQPFRTVIGVGRLIRGWDEGIPTMSLGESAILSITPEYGYGARGAGASIPPNADLIFEVELLEIVPKN